MSKLYERIRKPLALLLGTAAVCSYLFVAFWMTDPQGQLVNGEQEQSYVQIYLLDTEHDLIPFSVYAPLPEDKAGKIHSALTYMIQGQEPVSGCQGVLANDTVVEEVSIQDGVISLSFSSGFLHYDPRQELRLLEALVFTATQFDHTAEVMIFVDGKKLERMPQYQTPLPVVLDRTLGINNFEVSNNLLHESVPLTICYLKQQGEKEYYVLKTIRANILTDSKEVMVQAMMEDISVMSHLCQPLYQNGVRLLKVVSEQDDTLVLELNSDLLAEETTAQKQLITPLLISLKETTSLATLSILVEGETVSVTGVNEEPVYLKDMQYNTILLSNQ